MYYLCSLDIETCQSFSFKEARGRFGPLLRVDPAGFQNRVCMVNSQTVSARPASHSLVFRLFHFTFCRPDGNTGFPAGTEPRADRTGGQMDGSGGWPADHDGTLCPSNLNARVAPTTRGRPGPPTSGPGQPTAGSAAGRPDFPPKKLAGHQSLCFWLH